MYQPFETLIRNIDSPHKLIYGFVLILIIVYSSVIPSEYKLFADSILGRVFGIAIIYGVIQTLGWVYGLLTALAFLLILMGAPRIKEGFDGTVTTKETAGRKWFVEKVLGETPSTIATDKVISEVLY